MSADRVTGVVLAAGRSSRLGTPKQLLPYGRTTLLGATLEAARGCPFDQLVVALGAAVDDEVRAAVALDGVEAVVVEDSGAGCSSSLRAAMTAVDPEAAGIVLMLGDQPGVRPDTVARLTALRGAGCVAVCQYSDGIGHPLWLGREMFGDLARLHGDKAVWKLVEKAGAAGSLSRVPIDGTAPLDVDTWADYERLLATTGPVPR
jgi:molybdenum cofactor cytidylyltransferase